MKPPLRTKSVSTKVSEAEFALLEERARAAGLTLSEWVRDVLLTAPVRVRTGLRRAGAGRTAGPAVAVSESPVPCGQGLL